MSYRQTYMLLTYFNVADNVFSENVYSMSIEGPVVADVRDTSDTDRSDFDSLIDSAYELWLTQPRRGV